MLSTCPTATPLADLTGQLDQLAERVSTAFDTHMATNTPILVAIDRTDRVSLALPPLGRHLRTVDPDLFKSAPSGTGVALTIETNGDPDATWDTNPSNRIQLVCRLDSALDDDALDGQTHTVPVATPAHVQRLVDAHIAAMFIETALAARALDESVSLMDLLSRVDGIDAVDVAMYPASYHLFARVTLTWTRNQAPYTVTVDVQRPYRQHGANIEWGTDQYLDTADMAHLYSN